MHGGEAKEHAAAVGVQMGGALAHEVGQVQQAVAANGRALGFLVHEEVGVLAHAEGGLLLGAAEVIPEPLEGEASALGDAHHVPGAGHGAAEGVHTALGVDGDVVGVGEHHAGGADGGEGLAVPDHAGAHGSGSVGAAHHRSASLQAGELCGAGGDFAGDFGGLVHLGQEGGVDVQLLQDFLAPAAAGHVQQLHAGGVGDLGGELAGEHVAHIVLGQQNVGALGVELGLVVAHPQNLRGGKACQGGVGGDFNQPLLAHPLGDFLALGGGALVAPDDGAAQQVALLVQHHQAVHLAGDAHRLNLLVGDAALFDNGLDGLAGGVPPVQGVLLGPAVVLLIHGVLHGGAGHHMALLVEKHGFGAAGAQVDAD